MRHSGNRSPGIRKTSGSPVKRPSDSPNGKRPDGGSPVGTALHRPRPRRRMKLVLTEAALDDLRSIRAYTLEAWGEEQEER